MPSPPTKAPSFTPTTSSRRSQKRRTANSSTSPRSWTGCRFSPCFRGQAVLKHGENRHPHHDRGLVEELAVLLFCERRELVVGVNDGAFVGGDGMRPEFESHPQMFGGGLAGFDIERGGLEENIGARFFEPLAEIARLRRVAVLDQGMAVERRQWIKAIRVGDPAGAARGYPGESPANVVTPPQVRLFGDEKAEKRAGYVAHADDSQIVGRHEPLLREPAGETDRNIRPAAFRGRSMLRPSDEMN